MIELRASDIARLAGVTDMMPVLRQALIAHSAGKVWVPQRGRWSFDAPETTLLVMLASSEELGLSLVKTLTVVPSNSARNTPTIQGEVTLFTRDTGMPVARLEAEAITTLRTAACSALATQILADPQARTLAVFGTGPQAIAHIEAIRAIRPIDRVLLYGRNQKRTDALIALLQSGKIAVEPQRNLDRLVEAEIICTVTNAHAPLFDPDQISKSAHINAIGSFRPEMREVPAELVRTSKVFVDSAEFCASEAGELLEAFGSPADVRNNVVELGAALEQAFSRRSGNTIYKSVGNASQDLFASASILARARAEAQEQQERFS